ncbi:MAG: hypothetical protein E7533_00235 [Ruminococcaceae bacterium]|nr:hypothetical protein [Oscillospiraceae bacterium]
MKIKKNFQEHIDVLNRELKSFASRNPSVVFNEVANTDEDYTQGSLEFEGFTVIIRCHKNHTGYAFMEEPLFEETNQTTFGTVEATVEARFKFDFSPILFSIYDIHNIINHNDFRTLCFHKIVDENGIIKAIGEILDFTSKHNRFISNVSKDKNLQKQLITNYFEDERVFDKKFNEENFNSDIEENAELHEILMGIHLPIESGVYKFILTGNYKQLVKQFDKAEKKNNLIIFEKRYQKYLYDHSFQNVDESISKKMQARSKKHFWTTLLYIICFVLNAIIGLVLDSTISVFTVTHFHEGSLFLGTTNMRLELIGLLFAPMLILVPIAYKTSRLKDKVNRMFFKEKYDKALICVGIIALLLSVIMSFNTYKNHAIEIKNNTLYLDKTPINKSDYNIEFVYIKGTEYEDDNGSVIYETSEGYRSLLYVFDGDYQNYYHCELFEDDGYVTNTVLDKIKAADCKLTEHKTLEEFAEKNGFEIDE